MSHVLQPLKSKEPRIALVPLGEYFEEWGNLEFIG
jgi:hypothetical protein